MIELILYFEKMYLDVVICWSRIIIVEVNVVALA